MRSYILDTHIFLWAVLKPDRLSKRIQAILEDSRNNRYLSTASLWEISFLLETKPREFNLTTNLATFLDQAFQQLQVQILAITPEHAPFVRVCDADA